MKFDLRIYVAVTSFHPALRIYMYDEGLVRIATHEFSADPRDLSDPLAHLTNYSVQKHSKDYITNTEGNMDSVGRQAGAARRTDAND